MTNDYNEPLTPEQRQQILQELHRREFLEKQAVAEEKKAREDEAERQYRASLAEAAALAEANRMERLITDVSYSLGKISEALEALQQGDETKCYRLLVAANPNIGLVMQRLNQKPLITDISAGLPVLKVKRDTPLGFAIVNSSDVLPSDQIIEEDA